MIPPELLQSKTLSECLIKKYGKVSVENLWKLYAEMSFTGRTITPVQYAESKKVFMFGATQMFQIVVNDIASLPDDEACNELSKLQNEITDTLVKDAQVVLNRLENEAQVPVNP